MNKSKALKLALKVTEELTRAVMIVLIDNYDSFIIQYISISFRVG